jgi:hypothetical protein
MSGRSWTMHGRKRSRSPGRSRTPQKTRSPRQNLIFRAGGGWNQDEFARTLSEDMPSSTPAGTADEEADSSLSSACLSPATTPSTVPPQDNSSPITIYESHSGCSQSPGETWVCEETGPSRLNPASRVSPGYGFRSGQQHPRYDQLSFALASESSLTTGSIDYPTSSINPGRDGVGSPHSTNSWTEAHQVAEPGLDVGWQTYLSIKWPPGVPHPTAHNQSQSEHCSSLGVDGTEMCPVYPTTQIEAQPCASLAVPETRSNSVGSISIPHMSPYGIIRCGSCMDMDATYHTEESWLAHLQYRHPSWIDRDPSIPKTTGVDSQFAVLAVVLRLCIKMKDAGGFTSGWATRNGDLGFRTHASTRNASILLSKTGATGLRTYGVLTLIGLNGFRVTACGKTALPTAGPSKHPRCGWLMSKRRIGSRTDVIYHYAAVQARLVLKTI